MWLEVVELSWGVTFLDCALAQAPRYRVLNRGSARVKRGYTSLELFHNCMNLNRVLNYVGVR